MKDEQARNREGEEARQRKNETEERQPDPVETALQRAATEVEPSPTFIERLARRLRARHPASAPRRGRLPLWGWVAVAAATLVVLFLAGQALWPDLGFESPEAPGEPAQAAELPPALAESFPRPGEEVPADAAVTLRFSRPMDRASVEQALHVTPVVTGTFEWEDDQTVTFRPKALASATRYRVALDATAQADNGLPLNRDLAFAFSTLSPLTVTHTAPAAGDRALRSDTPLIVSFNYPLAPLNCTGWVADGDEGCSPLPLTVEPEVEGAGMWLNTSLYRFDPQPGWNAGETYTVTVPAGVESVAGARLDAPVTWSFSTAPPRVVGQELRHGCTDVPLETDVRLRFNTPMERAATEAAFGLTASDDETPVAGTFAWADNGAQLIFTPTQLLELGTLYNVRVGEGARAVSGTPLADAYAGRFTTVPAPAILGVQTSRGGEQLGYYDRLHVHVEGLLNPAEIEAHLRLTEDGEEIPFNTWWNDRESTLIVNWDLEPRTEYCLYLKPGLTDAYGTPVPEMAPVCYTSEPRPPAFVPAFSSRSLTLDAAEAARLYFAATNVDQVELTLYSQTERYFIGSREALVERLRDWTVSLPEVQDEVTVVPVDLAEGEPLPTGLYQLRWSYPGPREYQWNNRLRFAVVDRHVTFKLAEDEALFWVTDLRTGAPVADAEVRLISEHRGLEGDAVTDADGVARLPLPPHEAYWQSSMAVVGTPGEPGFGVAFSRWQEDTHPRQFDIDTRYYGKPAEYRVHLHTDRPIYRPGQLIHVAGVLREEQDVRYALPSAPLTVTLTLYDPQYERVDQVETAVSPEGSFTAAFDLAEDVPLGGYRLGATVPGDRSEIEWTLDLTVAAYRKPEFEVSVTPESDDVLDGETLRTLIESNYYAGGPVSDAEVQWTVRAEPYTFAPDIAGWWRWTAQQIRWGWQRDPEVVAEGRARTDDQGRFLLELPADLAPLGDEERPGSQRWTVETTVTDESGFPVTSRGRVTVHAGRFYLGLKPRRWVAQAGEEALVDVLALDWDATPVAGQEITLTLASRAWRHVPPDRPFGSPTWTFEDTEVSTLTVATDAGGKTVARLTPPRSGSYVVKAESRDDANNVIRGETSLWVSGPQAAAWKMAEGHVTPIADAQRYRPGETAEILLPTPFDGPFELLLTVERAGILEVQRLTVEEANPVIEVPIREEYVPNVVVSFVAVRGADATGGPDVRIGMVELEVEPTSQRLTVEVLPDREQYGPGEQAALTVRTLDAAGQPVDAEVTLAVVDKAVLALADPNAPTLLEAFYGKRPLRVLTGDSSLVLINRLTRDLERLAEEAERLIAEQMVGGMGGGGEGRAIYAADVREDFPDTAYWETQLRTGPTGETRVTFELPDSLTTWVAEARAVTAETQVGQTTTEFMVTRPLLVRPVTPRFLVAGDQVELAAVVHNNTAAPLEAEVNLEALGVRLDAEATQQVQIPAQGRVRVTWRAAVPRSGAEWALLTFSAAGGGHRDATRPTVGRAADHALPIYRYETPDVMATSGVLLEEDSRLEAILLPSEVGPESSLTVRLTPSLAAGMTEALDFLENFEHGCTEQLVSRFLPNAVTYRALQELGLENAELRANLEQVLEEALEELYARQQNTGGWGWFGNRTDLQVSAYAALGLVQAERAGFPIEERALARALRYLNGALPRDLKQEAGTLPQAFTLYVLAEAGEPFPEEADAELFAARDELEVTGRAYLALALGLQDPDDSRVRTLLEELRAEAEITATGARWEVSLPRYWVTTPRATALALTAFARLAPDDPLVPQATRWLMIGREADGWRTTQESAWSVMALTEVMLATGELDADYDWGVAFNGEPLGEGRVTPETLRKTTVLTVPAASMLREQPNALEVSRGAGDGALYYTADLALYHPVEEVQAESRGMIVQRRYCAVEGAPQRTKRDAELPECRPITSAQPGDLVEVRLTLILPRVRTYLVLEDWYPAGMEPVDSALKTEIEGAEPETQLPSRNVWWWQRGFEHQELRDERAVFYASRLSAGTYEVRYYLRAAVPGDYRVLPATASEMYTPEVWGRTEGAIFRVE